VSDARPIRHPQALGMMDDLDKALTKEVPGLKGVRRAKPASLYDIDTSRQAINRDVTRLPDAAEADFGRDMSHTLDEFLSNLDPSRVTARKGDPIEAVGKLKNARDLNSRMRKLEQMEEMTQKVERRAKRTSRGDIENATRQNLDALLGNKKARRGFTEDEIAAMDLIVRGTPGQNTLFRLGKLSPALAVGSGMGLGGAGIIGGTLGGPAGALGAAGVVGGVGYGAKKAAEYKSSKAIDDLYELIAAGGNKAMVKPRKNVAQKSIEKQEDLLRRLLLSASISDQ